jgi:hypothetical protein
MDENISMKNVLIYLGENYSGLKVIEAWGETSLFYNSDNMLKRGVYFCTLKNKDGENDKASCLYRDGVFRLNFGVRKKTFVSHFTQLPKRPSKGGVIEGNYDFEKIDRLMPHPVYGWMSWLSILNPSKKSLEVIQPLIDESYSLCIEKYKKRCG